MIKPVTYAEWVECFEQLKAGTNDEEIILKLEQGTIEWSKGVAERLTQHLFDTIESRLKRTSDLLQKELDGSYGNETMIVKAVLSARKRLALLKRVADLPAFPDNVRGTMLKVLSDYAKNTQESLEKSALSDRTGRLRSLFRNNNLTQFAKVENVFGNSVSMSNEMNRDAKNPQVPGVKSSRRRVILP
ncbi:hypothetical protein [Lysinibacillus xylanilyticus]|uniref:hypothetical protein n=1 Tax=Lysinibacillus xylanilyticus TaxID=582475 RepID=UPI003828DC4C